MIIYTKEDFIAVLDRTIRGEDITVDWEDLIMASTRGDSFTRHWADKIAAVEGLYPPTHARELFAQEGINYLQKILAEIKSLDSL